MIALFFVWSLLAAIAVGFGLTFSLPLALGLWAGLTAALCTGGAWLISRQPLGVATFGGRLGCCFVRWGFRAGRGQLAPAMGISWLIWQVVGAAAIMAARYPEHAPLIACWVGDSWGLFHVAGLLLSQRGGGRVSASLLKFCLLPVGLVAVSTYLWFYVGSDFARGMAFLIAGGPPLFAGIGYAIAQGPNLFSRRRANS